MKKVLLFLTGLSFFCIYLEARETQALNADLDRALAGIKAVDGKIDPLLSGNKLADAQVEAFLASAPGTAVNQQVDDAIAHYAAVLGALEGAGGIEAPDKKVVAAAKLKSAMNSALKKWGTETDVQKKQRLELAVAAYDAAIK
ncbi:MAG: hypothetical protein WCS92_03090 [Candidatus Babeliales bacterium]|jgi:hypothetical protein